MQCRSCRRHHRAPKGRTAEGGDAIDEEGGSGSEGCSGSVDAGRGEGRGEAAPLAWSNRTGSQGGDDSEAGAAVILPREPLEEREEVAAGHGAVDGARVAGLGLEAGCQDLQGAARKVLRKRRSRRNGCQSLHNSPFQALQPFQLVLSLLPPSLSLSLQRLVSPSFQPPLDVDVIGEGFPPCRRQLLHPLLCRAGGRPMSQTRICPRVGCDSPGPPSLCVVNPQREMGQKGSQTAAQQG